MSHAEGAEEAEDRISGHHRKHFPGFAERARTLEQRGLLVERQKPISFELDGMRFEQAFRVDLLVERRVVVELKSVEWLTAVHPKQVLTYLRLLNLPIGLLINFGAARLNDGGVHRIVNSRASAARVILDG